MFLLLYCPLFSRFLPLADASECVPSLLTALFMVTFCSFAGKDLALPLLGCLGRWIWPLSARGGWGRGVIFWQEIILLTFMRPNSAGTLLFLPLSQMGVYSKLVFFNWFFNKIPSFLDLLDNNSDSMI